MEGEAEDGAVDKEAEEEAGETYGIYQYNRWKYGCMSAVRGVWSERTDVQQRVK